jgi:hypothetical protein
MFLDQIKGTKQFATFTLANGEAVGGEFLLDGARTHLILYTHKARLEQSGDLATLHAELPTLGSVSFLNCISLGEHGQAGQGRQTHQVHFYPHFATLGARPLLPDTGIRRLGVVIDDFASIYDDFDAFGVDLAPSDHITDILEALHAKTGRRVEPGDRPVIAYYKGRGRLFSARAPFGRVGAGDRVRYGMGGPGGVSINNTVMTHLEFDSPTTFSQTIESLGPVLRFLELMAGRRQNLLHVELELDLPPDLSDRRLEAYWCSPPNRPPAVGERRPHPMDVPLKGGKQPAEFAAVLEHWLAVDHERRDARLQFSDGFSKGNSYDNGRLVSAANTFDILPATAVPKDVDLPEDLQAARAEARRVFRALPQSIERDSVLGALGRLGTASLKHKTRHRGQIVLAAKPKDRPDLFPDLIMVLDEAVNCRNHYVHGSSAKIDYRRNFFETVPFFTDTLEFVFAASDLIEAGWEIGAWIGETTGSHPFGSYCASYKERLRALKALLAL